MERRQFEAILPPLETLQIKHGTDEWHAFRNNGIGGSDAAAVLGISPFMSNGELYMIKTGQQKPKDLSGNPAVDFGNKAEKHIASLFALDYAEHFDVSVNKNVVYRRGFAFCSLDGELLDRSSHERGILEVKTAYVKREKENMWEGKMPNHYFIQVLHNMMVYGASFGILVARIKFSYSKDIVTRSYFVEAQEHQEDMMLLFNLEKEFWEHVQNRTLPAEIMKGI